MEVLKVKNLTKKFGDFAAVNNVSFSLQEGEILGLLGPNGAGKTTTLQMLLGISTPTKGQIFYFGKNFSTHRSEVLEQVNFSSAYTHLPKLLTVEENLKYTSYLYDIKDRKKRIAKIVDTFQLKDLLKKEARMLSAGQTTRLNIAKAFINFPKIIMMDEPTASLDPDVAEYIREFVANERKQFQVSIIITSHNMSEVEELCDRVVFINHGKVIADDTPFNLAKTIQTSHLRLLFGPAMLSKFHSYADTHKITYTEKDHYVLIDISEKEIPNFLKTLMSEKIEYDEISIERPTLEDFFLEKAKTGKIA